MELHFLGTGSAFPTPKRCASCTALRYNGSVWIFDCGEGSQIQFHKCSLRPGRISKIFITHLHGDHLFGLPGLLCTIGMNGSASEQAIDIYGPRGIRNFLRCSLGLSYSRLGYTFAVHELLIPTHSAELPVEDQSHLHLSENLSRVCLPSHFNETNGSDIPMDSNGVFHVCETADITVTALLLRHTVPTVGYVLQEKSLPGKLDISVLGGKGVPKGPLYGKIKQGESITLPNGELIRPEDCLGPPKPGRKLVVLGDTCYSDNIRTIAADCDVLVHECTNENADIEKAVQHGHSVPDMVGEFASKIGARKLVLTHFSQRYRGLKDEIKPDTESVQKLVDEIRMTYSKGDVIAAEDLMSIDLPLPRS